MFTWKALAQGIVILALFVLLGAAAMVTIPNVEVVPPVPACQEDQLIMGSGDFAAGYWTVYTCVNLEGI